MGKESHSAKDLEQAFSPSLQGELVLAHAE